MQLYRMCVFVRTILTVTYSESLRLQSLATCVSWVAFNVIMVYGWICVFCRKREAGEGANVCVGKYV